MQTKITAKTNRPKDRVFHSWHNQDLICGSVLQHDMSKLSKYCQKSKQKIDEYWLRNKIAKIYDLLSVNLQHVLCVWNIIIIGSKLLSSVIKMENGTLLFMLLLETMIETERILQSSYNECLGILLLPPVSPDLGLSRKVPYK